MNHRTPASVDDVAQTIEHAIATDDPKLRYLVGQDAVEFVAARRRVSDEDYIMFSAIEDDEDYFDAMKELIGKEYFRPWPARSQGSSMAPHFSLPQPQGFGWSNSYLASRDKIFVDP